MFVLGLIIGMVTGMLLMSLCAASARADRKDNR